jgi:energy-coupling factor transporter transmembrane protein EcfT
MDRKQSIIYGAVVGVVIFFVGWSTGMGGSVIPNFVFSVLMGILAMIIIRIFTKFIDKNK